MKVKLLDPRAKAPTVNYPHSDLGYDLYALDDAILYNGQVRAVRTGIAIEFPEHLGGIIKDRSSMALRGIMTSAGVVDSGYRGEIIVLMTYFGPLELSDDKTKISAGDKIAQLVLQKSLTFEEIRIVDELEESERGEKGFGSSGR